MTQRCVIPRDALELKKVILTEIYGGPLPLSPALLPPLQTLTTRCKRHFNSHQCHEQLYFRLSVATEVNGLLKRCHDVVRSKYLVTREELEPKSFGEASI